MNGKQPRWGIRLAIILAVVLTAGAWAWQILRPDGLGKGFASGNGRIEAIEVDVATKLPGRIADILVDEGDFVQAGQVVAHMDTLAVEAQMAQAQAQVRQAENAVLTTEAMVAQRESERATAQAALLARQADRGLAEKRLARTRALLEDRASSQQELDDDEARMASAEAAVHAARAQIGATEAGIRAARAQVIQARSTVEAAQALVAQVQTQLDESVLRAPRAGRVQYRVAQPGEVLGGGGKLLSMVDLSDVYMNFFLPETVAGRVALGAEVHLILDAAPQYVIPAQVSYVASVAQFTPKTVETKSERQKLMFRVKARIAPELLDQHLAQVKTGLPGVAYLRLDAQAEWPPQLATKLP